MEYTYIVFEDSGLDISKLIKENNPKTRIIHLYHGNYIDRSKADEIIELKTDFEGLSRCLGSYVRKKSRTSQISHE